MKKIIPLLLMLLSLDTYSQMNQNLELEIVDCLKKEFQAIDADIDTEFNLLIDTLISQRVLRNRNPESIYDLYDMIRYVSVLNYRNTYQIEKLESNYKLIYDCIFLFKTDTSDTFKKTKLFKFYTVLNSLENGPSIITFVNDIQSVLEPKDMNIDMYKYYTLYLFYSLFTTEKLDIPKSDINIPAEQIIEINIDQKGEIYFNNKKVNKNRIEASIDNQGHSLIKIVANDEVPVSDIIFILKIAEEMNIQVKIENK